VQAGLPELHEGPPEACHLHVTVCTGRRGEKQKGRQEVVLLLPASCLTACLVLSTSSMCELFFLLPSVILPFPQRVLYVIEIREEEGR